MPTHTHTKPRPGRRPGRGPGRRPGRRPRRRQGRIAAALPGGPPGPRARICHALAAIAWLAAAASVSLAAETPQVLVVVGAGGADTYAAEFAGWAAQWRDAAEQGGAEFTLLGPPADAAASPQESRQREQASEPDSTDRERLEAALARMTNAGEQPLWLVLIGHGTFDGREARFNLRGPDITAQWLQTQLAECRRPLAVMLCFSSSAPFLNQLSGPDRVVISAVKSGHERNYSRFGGHLASAVADIRADLDKDQQTSLLEAFLLASQRTSQEYAADNRLVTEHPLLDDNGDQKGSPADWYRGVHPIRSPKEGRIDGPAAHRWRLVPSPQERDASPEHLRQRDALERQIEALRARRDELSDQQYLQQLEPLMVRLARLMQQANQHDP